MVEKTSSKADPENEGEEENDLYKSSAYTEPEKENQGKRGGLGLLVFFESWVWKRGRRGFQML